MAGGSIGGMNAHKDWSSLPSPGRIVAGLAFHAAFLAVMDVPPRHTPEPGRVAYDDGGGSSFVLDLGGAAPVLAVRDRDEPAARPDDEGIRAVLGRSGPPEPFASAPERGLSGAARWDGTAWTPAAGVPGRVVTHLTDDAHLLAEADIALGEVAEGESDPDALAALLASVRAGAWDRDAVEAAVRLTPYEDDEELDAEPDPEAALHVLGLYAPVLREALEADRAR
ncbi:hypothetical protein SUDANB99_02506 [Streptomyces sp. enrichment culture]